MLTSEYFSGAVASENVAGDFLCHRSADAPALAVLIQSVRFFAGLIVGIMDSEITEEEVEASSSNENTEHFFMLWRVSNQYAACEKQQITTTTNDRRKTSKTFQRRGSFHRTTVRTFVSKGI